MQISFASTRPEGAHALALVVAAGASLDGLTGLDAGAARLVAEAAKAARFDGEATKVVELFVAEGEGVRRLLLLGLGKDPAEPGELQRAGAALAAKLQTSGEARAVLDLTGSPLSGPQAAELGFGAVQRAWRHDAYRTKLPAAQRASLNELVIVGAGEGAAEASARLRAVADGMAFTRELVTEPANVIFPVSFAERCRELEAMGVEVEVLDEPAMRELGMGALLAVSQGSAQPPRLVAMRWNGAGDAGGAPPLVLIGKGVTFDTGGISIKPAAGMEQMKWDMGGAGAVAGTMRALAGRKAKANVVGVVGLVENMPSGTATRPGDVVTSMNGQTVEVINTDAEGRLVLADAMTWAQRQYKPKVMIDLATLTGAMIISLGHDYAGVFSNSDELAARLDAAGKATCDLVWRMPMNAEFDKLINSDIADIKNVGPREGGSITAAQFLKRFVDEGVEWAHIDIAGVVWANKPGATFDKGATGWGVRILDRFVSEHFEQA
ncbi:MAG: Cytosol aminopeptidase PepA [uncultured Sphingomonadaceae bacterium]|uniref:Probable cytosol aminopeptidase n=1 Tax=uncultured Sphingomonadaceae bacterium TaxID=169976 RepID=A0A6J4TEH3_9SPHN|nr:MAG: Cytosol aminopeptidase PepA [uncultured Sphingomonadaceae bacterium]